ncbi:hypothetical protein [Actinoplanes subglobosus]|uniref:Uncharacterized protein n=1 Tax=Actinoplanes subglobosus TaxID=1547892 RepID=A0ABV8IZR2_9ACTN
MARNTHRDNCANAQNPGCVCSGCGGALHGWQGWTRLARDVPSARDDRRRRIEARIERNQRTDELNFNARNRQALVDLARLDITEHLWDTDPKTPPAEPQAQTGDLSDPALSSSDLRRLSTLGDKLMAEPWKEIDADIDRQIKNQQTALDVKRRLADHTWCGLLVALIRWIEKIDTAVQIVTDKAKEFVKDFLVDHLSGLPGKLAEIVVDIVIDRVWSALARLVEAHFPLLGDDTLRALRMLALFACPSVERHPQVYQYTAEPLMGDALNLVSEEVKEQVSTLFNAWWRRRAPEALA